MSNEELQIVLEKHGVKFDPAAAEILNAISRLPTSEIFELFNEIAIEDVFRKNTELRLF